MDQENSCYPYDLPYTPVDVSIEGGAVADTVADGPVKAHELPRDCTARYARPAPTLVEAFTLVLPALSEYQDIL
jgi:hypothetical protein